ncbi:MAG: hypothetical protein E6I70_16470, partial [Chloroflexi bacterium]
RVQIHKSGSEVRVFSRNLEDYTLMFAELTAAARDLKDQTLILDGEAIAYSKELEEYLPFQLTASRRRQHGIEQAALELPLVAFIFDILYRNGRDLTDLPYEERLALVDDVIAGSTVLLPAPIIKTDSVEVLTKTLLDNISQGLEGVVVKRPDSKYQGPRPARLLLRQGQACGLRRRGAARRGLRRGPRSLRQHHQAGHRLVRCRMAADPRARGQVASCSAAGTGGFHPGAGCVARARGGGRGDGGRNHAQSQTYGRQGGRRAGVCASLSTGGLVPRCRQAAGRRDDRKGDRRVVPSTAGAQTTRLSVEMRSWPRPGS